MRTSVARELGAMPTWTHGGAEGRRARQSGTNADGPIAVRRGRSEHRRGPDPIGDEESEQRADALLARAIAAHGGDERLSKLKSLVLFRKGDRRYGDTDLRFSDFRAVNGVVVPLTRIASFAGKDAGTRLWTEVVVDGDIDPAVFAPRR